MKKVELLAPAGSFEKAKIAFLYGADAVYCGTASLSLRSRAAIDDDDLMKTIEYAHKLGKKVYVAMNIYAFDTDYDEIKSMCKKLEEVKPDGIIASDPGVISTILKYAPSVPVNVSTQSNLVSLEACKFWYNQGCKRMIMAREMDKNQLKYIKVTKKEELILLTKSKYFQCELTTENYTELIEESNKNTILVSGTPCQISAMKNIPKLNKENTIFLEILCQGVPNDFVIKKYDSEKEKKFNKKIVKHIFRSKDKYVGKNYLNKYMFNDGSLKYYIGEEDPLSLTFQRQMFLRESCYKCEYSQEQRVADFTVGDYWEDDIKNKNIVLENGVSIILCNTEKAQKFLKFIDIFNVEERDYKKALKNNIPFHRSVKRPFARNYSYKLLELGLKPSIVAKIICYKYYMKRIIKKLR